MPNHLVGFSVMVAWLSFHAGWLAGRPGCLLVEGENEEKAKTQQKEAFVITDKSQASALRVGLAGLAQHDKDGCKQGIRKKKGQRSRGHGDGQRLWGPLVHGFLLNPAYSMNSQILGFSWRGCWPTSYSLHGVHQICSMYGVQVVETRYAETSSKIWEKMCSIKINLAEHGRIAKEIEGLLGGLRLIRGKEGGSIGSRGFAWVFIVNILFPVQMYTEYSAHLSSKCKLLCKVQVVREPLSGVDSSNVQTWSSVGEWSKEAEAPDCCSQDRDSSGPDGQEALPGVLDL